MKIPSSMDRAAGPARAHGASLWSYAGYVAVGGIAAIALLAVLMLGKLLPAATAALETQSHETHGRTYAALFDGRLLELRRWLAAAAAAPAVRDALASGDGAALREASAFLASVLEFAARVEIYPPGAAQLDPTAPVPISYAALEAIKGAQAGAFVGPVAVGGANKAIYVAQPVEADGQVLGVVFAAIEPGYFLDPLATFDTSYGQLTLEQAFDDSHALSVLTWGEADADEPFQRLELSVPHWALLYRPGRNTVPEALAAAPIIAAVVVAIALFAIALVLAFLLLGRNLQRDANRLRDNLVGLASDDLAGGYRLEVLARLGADVTDKRAGHGPPTATARPAEPQANPDDLVTDAAASAALGTGEEFLEIAPRDAAATPAVAEPPSLTSEDSAAEVDPEIFRAYDIRGITGKTLTDDAVYRIGRAFAAEALEHGQRRIAVGRDGRHSSLPLRNVLVRGLTEGGVDVADIGEVPTPMLYFATHALETGSGIMITGSHNPPDYNGLKLMLDGVALAGAQIQALRERIEKGRFSDGAGVVEIVDLRETYLDRILSDVVVAQPLKVVVDCGNGVAGGVVPELLSRLDCDVVPLYCDVDGSFPNHHPDPADPHNLEDLITVVKAEGADLGLAFDGDGDRLGVVTGSGRIIWPDKLLMLFAQDIVGRNPGADIIYDVKCSRHLNSVISELGGRPIMWKTGHSHIKAKLQETGALLAGEFSGHICFGERWYGFDDALYAAARLLEILGGGHESADELFGQFPRTVSTPELKIETGEQAKFAIIERLVEAGDFGAGTLTTIDGVRVDYEDGWGLIRPSNTSPFLTLRFEADDEQALARIQAIFAAQLSRIDPELTFRQSP